MNSSIAYNNIQYIRIYILNISHCIDEDFVYFCIPIISDLVNLENKLSQVHFALNSNHFEWDYNIKL